jgi:hypothetical protein
LMLHLLLRPQLRELLLEFSLPFFFEFLNF